MTELSGACHITPFEGETKSGSVGLLLPNLECKVSVPMSIVILQPPRKIIYLQPGGLSHEGPGASRTCSSSSGIGGTC